MSTRTSIERGQIFTETDAPREAWRVEKQLVDGAHVVLVKVDQPSRRKTFSIWALKNPRLFTPRAAADVPAAG